MSQDYGKQLLGWCCGCGSHPIDRSVKECKCARHVWNHGVTAAQFCAVIVYSYDLNSSPDAAWISGLEVTLSALLVLVGMQVSLSLNLKTASHALSRDHKSQSSYGFPLETRWWSLWLDIFMVKRVMWARTAIFIQVCVLWDGIMCL